MDSAPPVDQECAFTVFTYTLNAARLAGQRIEFWRTRFPSPQPALHSRPDTVFTVLIQTEHAMTKRAILPPALDAAIPNRAEAAGRNPRSVDPYRAFPILKQLENILSGKFRILSEFAVLPTGKSFRGANPKRPV